MPMYTHTSQEANPRRPEKPIAVENRGAHVTQRGPWQCVTKKSPTQTHHTLCGPDGPNPPCGIGIQLVSDMNSDVLETESAPGTHYVAQAQLPKHDNSLLLFTCAQISGVSHHTSLKSNLVNQPKQQRGISLQMCPFFAHRCTPKLSEHLRKRNPSPHFF